VALLGIKKHTRKGASKSKKDADVYLSDINDEDKREKVRYMLEKGIDKSRVQTILTKIPRTQDEIAAQIGVPAGTLRSSLHHIRRYGVLSMSEGSAKIAEYLVEQGYEPKK
jgi:DNA-binding protein Fis